MTNDQNASIYHAAPGGSDLMRWFGRVPSFHDAELLNLCLGQEGQNALRIHGWNTTDKVGHDGCLLLDRHAVVTFALEGIMDLQLEGFSVQNIIGGLVLRRAPDRPARRSYLSLKPQPDDVEIEIEQCYGLGGLIRARSVAITFEPGQPNAGAGKRAR